MPTEIKITITDMDGAPLESFIVTSDFTVPPHVLATEVRDLIEPQYHCREDE